MTSFVNKPAHHVRRLEYRPPSYQYNTTTRVCKTGQNCCLVKNKRTLHHFIEILLYPNAYIVIKIQYLAFTLTKITLKISGNPSDRLRKAAFESTAATACRPVCVCHFSHCHRPAYRRSYQSRDPRVTASLLARAPLFEHTFIIHIYKIVAKTVVIAFNYLRTKAPSVSNFWQVNPDH